MLVQEPLGSGALYSPSSTSHRQYRKCSSSASSRNTSTQKPSKYSFPDRAWKLGWRVTYGFSKMFVTTSILFASACNRLMSRVVVFMARVWLEYYTPMSQWPCQDFSEMHRM